MLLLSLMPEWSMRPAVGRMGGTLPAPPPAEALAASMALLAEGATPPGTEPADDCRSTVGYSPNKREAYDGKPRFCCCCISCRLCMFP